VFIDPCSTVAQQQDEDRQQLQGAISQLEKKNQDSGGVGIFKELSQRNG